MRGVQAETADGTVDIKANKGVVRAGGDWSSDVELKERFSPAWKDIPGFSMAVWGNDGTATRMGLEAGGIVVNGNSYWCNTQRNGFGTMSLQLCNETDGMLPGGKSIFVDERGNRTFCEDLYMSYAAARIAESVLDRPGGHVWNIMDQETLDGQLKACAEDLGYGYLVQEDLCVFADTYEEMAEKLGMPCLVDTIEAYNKYAEQGEDPQFNRRPGNIAPIKEPLAAARLATTWSYYCQGALDVDRYGHALDVDGNPIPGLFASGRSARGLAEGKYTQVTGMSCGAGLIMGRQIGLQLAQGDPNLSAAEGTGEHEQGTVRFTKE